MTTTYEHLRTSTSDGVPLVYLTDTKFLERQTIQDTQSELIAYLELNTPTRLVISFKDVAAISSEFIATLIRCREYVKSSGGELRLSDMNPVVRMAFKVTKLDGTLLMIYDTVPLAIDSLQR